MSQSASGVQKGENASSAKKIALGVIGLVVFAVIAFFPPFEGLTQSSMMCLALLVAVVYFVTAKIIDEFLAGAIGLVLIVLLQIADFGTAFSGFSNSTFILLLGAFGMGGILAQTGALARVCDIIMAKFPKTFRGRVSALMLSGLVVSPLIPSGSAKGVIMSLVSTSAGKLMGYKEKSQAAAGLYMAGWIPVGVVGVCFLSGCVSGPLLAGMVDAQYAAQFTWMNWFLNSLTFGIVMLIGSFIAINVLYKPRLGDVEAVAQVEVEQPSAKKEPMTKKQWASLGVIVLCLVLWIFSKTLGLSDAWVAFAGFVLMVVLGCADRKKVLNTCIPWGTLIFTAFILSISSCIGKTGIDVWLTGIAGNVLVPIMSNIWLFIPLACIVIYLIRMIIISQTLVTSTMFILLMPVGIAAGVDPWIIGFICATTICTWNVLPQSIPFLSAFGAANGYVDFTHCVKMSVFVMVWTIVCLLVSVPVWSMLGLM